MIYSDALPAGSELQGGVLRLDQAFSQSHFGITYRGNDTRLRRRVAVKEFFPTGCVRAEGIVQPHGMLTTAAFVAGREHFLDEARALAQFRHPGIVHVYSFFEENNTAYMVMEYLEGETLQEVVDRGPLPEARALATIVQLGQALHEVHRAQMLHCDIKPENVIVCREPSHDQQWLGRDRVVLIDFGLCTLLPESGNYYTRQLTTDSRFGTPGYAPLEQYTQQAELGAFTDIYALGATLYHLLTGKAPTPAADRAYGVPLPPPHSVNIVVSQAVSDATMWALRLKADERPQTIDEFLERLLQRDGVTAARSRLLSLLHYRATVLQEEQERAARQVIYVPVAPRHVSHPGTAQAPAPRQVGGEDEQACLQACFIGCLAMWFVGVMAYFGFWLLHFLVSNGY